MKNKTNAKIEVYKKSVYFLSKVLLLGVAKSTK